MFICGRCYCCAAQWLTAASQRLHAQVHSLQVRACGGLQRHGSQQGGIPAGRHATVPRGVVSSSHRQLAASWRASMWHGQQANGQLIGSQARLAGGRPGVAGRRIPATWRRHGIGPAHAACWHHALLAQPPVQRTVDCSLCGGQPGVCRTAVAAQRRATALAWHERALPARRPAEQQAGQQAAWATAALAAAQAGRSGRAQLHVAFSSQPVASCQAAACPLCLLHFPLLTGAGPHPAEARGQGEERLLCRARGQAGVRGALSVFIFACFRLVRWLPRVLRRARGQAGVRGAHRLAFSGTDASIWEVLGGLLCRARGQAGVRGAYCLAFSATDVFVWEVLAGKFSSLSPRPSWCSWCASLDVTVTCCCCFTAGVTDAMHPRKLCAPVQPASLAAKLRAAQAPRRRLHRSAAVERRRCLAGWQAAVAGWGLDAAWQGGQPSSGSSQQQQQHSSSSSTLDRPAVWVARHAAVAGAMAHGDLAAKCAAESWLVKAAWRQCGEGLPASAGLVHLSTLH